MKKKLFTAFLAAAMMISLAPVTEKPMRAEAAMAIVYNKTAKNINLNKKQVNMYVGGIRINLDYNIGGKTSGVKGKWTSSDSDVVTVNQYGTMKAVGNGTAKVKFTYKSGSTNKTLSVTVKSRTRASAITLKHEPENTNLNPGQFLRLSAELTTNPKALAVNENVTTTYLTSYEVYTDRECTTQATSGAIELTPSGNSATLKAVSTGEYYVRAIGKNTPNAKKLNVYSDPLTVTVSEAPEAASAKAAQSGANKITVTSNYVIDSILVTNTAGAAVAQTKGEQTADGKTMIFTAASPLSGSFNITANTAGGVAKTTVSCVPGKAAMLKLDSATARLEAGAENGKSSTAYINYSLFDQFGNNITNDESFPFTGQFIAMFDNNSGALASVDSRGLIKIPLSAKQSVQGYKGELKLIYAGSSFTKDSAPVTLTTPITIGAPTVVQSIEIGGIYSYNASSKNYDLRVNNTVVSAHGGDTIVSESAVTPLKTNGAWYLLVNAKDSTGNDIISSADNLIDVEMKSTPKYNTGANVMELDRTATAGAVKIGKTSYMAFPLKAGVVTAGSIDVKAFAGNTAFSRLQQNIPDQVSLGSVTINTTSASYSQLKDGRVVLDATFRDNSGAVVTDYNKVIELLANDLSGAVSGNYYYIREDVLKCDKGMLIIQKKSDGTAELSLLPTFNIYPVGQAVATTVTEYRTDANGVKQAHSYPFFVTRTD